MKNTQQFRGRGKRRWDVDLRRGFTVVELMAVIAIIGLMVVVMIPAMQPSQSAQLNAAARQLSNMMAQARQYAIANNVRVRMVFATKDTFTIADPPTLKSMAYRSFAVLAMPAITATNQVQTKPSDKFMVPLFSYVKAWATLPAGVVIDPAGQDVITPGYTGWGRNKAPFTKLRSSAIGENPRTVSVKFPDDNGALRPVWYADISNKGIGFQGAFFRLTMGYIETGDGYNAANGGLVIRGRAAPLTISSATRDPACMMGCMLSMDSASGEVSYCRSY